MFTIPIVIAGFAGCLILLERAFPDQPLPRVEGWWGRVALVNGMQFSIVLLGMLTWERAMQGWSLFRLGGACGPAAGGILAYLLNTFLFYWWHRARHDVNGLWLGCHQLHHSPQRIETLTSFYKHPVEILANSLIMGALAYPVLGLEMQAGLWLTGLSGLVELLYHMNLRTPRWMGYLVQRPEMHRLHHERGVHYRNFSDLPVWDMLFGTYANPPRADRPCGFLPEREARFLDMLLFRNVNGPYRGARRSP